MNNQPNFSELERDALYKVIYVRRDMRHFVEGSVDNIVLSRIFSAGHAAPSVGFMQPWRFIRITKPQLREKLAALVEEECTHTAIQNMWLAARAENLGMGWGSLFEPADVASLLICPAGSKPLALLCLGPVKVFYDKPMRVREH